MAASAQSDPCWNRAARRHTSMLGRIGTGLLLLEVWVCGHISCLRAANAAEPRSALKMVQRPLR